jgi:hypothetical protein
LTTEQNGLGPGAARLAGVAVRRIVVDPDLDLAIGPQPEGVEVGVGGALDPAPFEPHEVLLVSADEDRLVEAGRLGIHRVVADDDPRTTADAVDELVAFLDRT